MAPSGRKVCCITMNNYETICPHTSVAGPTAARALAWQLSLSCRQGGTLFSTLPQKTGLPKVKLCR